MDNTELPANILTLIEEFNRSGLRELHIRRGDFELLLSHADRPARAPVTAIPRAAPMAPAPAKQVERAASALPASAAPMPAAADYPEDAVLVLAPNLGTFYRSPKPGAPPFVEVGQKIAAGTELCLIEVMKLFTTVRAEVAGSVVAVLVEDGAMVEAGQPLFAVSAG
jgi:acetyl-CoA carboxylase biotin carboxyl carrier protein